MANKKLIPTVGAKFGKWTVIAETTVFESGNTQWECECECGKRKFVAMNNLMNGKSTQCSKCAAKSRGHKLRKGCGDISGDMWCQMTNTYPYNISIEEAWELFKSQDGKCAVSGMPIEIHGYPYDREMTTAHLCVKNRENNVDTEYYWLYIDVALMKPNHMSHDYFIELIWKIADRQAVINK